MAFKDWLKEYRESKGSQDKTSVSSNNQTPTTRSPGQTTSGTSGSGTSGSSFRDWLHEYRGENETDSVESWAKNSINLITDVQKNSGNWYDDNEYQSRYDRFTNLLAQADGWRKQYSGNEEAISYINSVVAALEEAQSYSFNARKFYSQWENGEEYLKWDTYQTAEGRQEQYKKNKARLEELKDERPNARSRKEIDEEIAKIEAEIQMYERGGTDESGFYYGSKVVDDYQDVTKRPDFLDTSTNRTYGNPTKAELAQNDAKNDSSMWYFDADGVYRDAYGNELTVDENGNWVNPNSSAVVADRLGLYLGASERERQEALGTPIDMEGTWETVIKDGEDGSWDQLTENEIAIYYYLLNSEGQQSADKYLFDMKTELNRRDTMEGKAGMAASFDDASVLEKIALSVATVPAQLLGGVAGVIENTANTLMGNEINPYSAAHSGTHFSSTARGLQAAELDETGFAIPLIDFTLGDMYQSGMSILDSYAAIGIGGKLGGALLATGAASSEATRLYEQGASMNQIAIGSAAAGAAEMVFESLSIDKLINMKDAKTVGQMVKNVLIQGGIEASEEGFTEIANILTNAIIMGSESDWEKLVAENGGDKWKAFLSEVQTVAHSAFAGFLSGAGSASVPSAASYAGTQAQYNQTGSAIMGADGGVDALKALAMDVSGADSKLAEQAGKVNSEPATGEGFGKVTAAVKNRINENKVGKLYQAVETEVSTQNQADIAKSLERKGFSSKSAKSIAEAIVTHAEGRELSKYQKAVLNSVSDNDMVKETVNNIIGNAKSTSNYRSAKLATFAMGIDAGVGIAPNASSTKSAKQSQENSFGEGNLTAAAESGVESHYEVSAEGKTILKSNPDQVVNIQDIASVENGRLVLKTEDGTVDASDLDYATRDEALVYEAVSNLSGIIDTNTANKLSKHLLKLGGASSDVYPGGIVQAYTYGYYGYGREAAKGKNTLSSTLTEKQRNVAYGLGEQYRSARTEADQARASKNATTANKDSNKVTGKVHFDGDRSALTERQNTSLTAMETVAEALGVQIYVFESELNERGQRVGANGWYDPKDNSIHIDLHAGANGEGTMLFTAAHELTHFIRQWSPAKFKILADFLMQEYGKKGVSVDALVREQMAKAERNGRTISYDIAYEEVVADSMEMMLSDGNVMEKLAKLKQVDKSLWQKIKDFISELAAKIREVYKGLAPDSVEGRYVAEMVDAIDRLQEMFTEGLVEASENFQSAEKNTTQESGEMQYSLREFEDGTRFVDVQMDANVFDGMTVTQMNQAVKPILMERFAGKVIGIDNRAFVNGDSVNEYLHPSKSIDMDTRRAKLTAAGELDNLLDAGKALPNKPDGEDGHIHPDAIDFSYFKTIFKVGNEYFEGIVNIKNIKRGKLLKDVTKIKNITQDIVSSYGQNPKSNFLRDVSMDSIRNEGENVKNETAETLMDAGIAVDSKTDAGSLFSVRDVLDDTNRKKVANALVDRFGVTEKEAMEWLRAETSLASLILNPKYSTFLDYEADPSELAIKQNLDYPQGTVDFSNICKKRREFTQVMNRVLRNFPNHVFAATDLAKIRTIMGEEGMTLPCGICYVEDRRQLDTIVAQDFIDGLKLYREGSKTRPDGKLFNANQLKGLKLTDGDTYVPTIYELVSLEGRNSLKAKNPNMEAAWVRYNNARGMQSVRLLTNEAEYKRQILKYSKNTVQSKNDKGGLRIYSFSDAEMFHLIDIIQVITDSAAVGLYLQGYTKVNEYAKAVKDTGEKLNRSLIPLGDRGYHMENGKVVLDYDTVEGIDIYHEDFFDNKDNPNIGNITIGINNTQIRAAMVSDFVDQIIPFHTGQSEEVLGEKGIAAWDNYKDFQTEKDMATGKTSNHQVNIYTEVFQAAETEGKPIQNKRQFVEKFLQVCKENGLQPRFSQFLNTDAQGNYIYTEGYHKFLVDFKTFAQTEVGEYLPQGQVKPIFDNTYITGLLKAYVKEQKVKDAEVAKQMPKVIERITNEIIKQDEVKYSDRVTDQDTLVFLNGQIKRGEYITTYKSMRLDDGKLHSPMAAEINGKFENEYELGAWYQAVEHPELIKFDKKNGLPYFDLDKGVDEFGDELGKVAARYNPYEHSSNYVINDQFKTAFKRSNLVVVEMRIPLSEITSGYQAQYAKDPVGWQEWKKGDVASALAKKGKERKVLLSRWAMPYRILSDAEVAQQYKELLSGSGVKVPNNVVTPSLLKALEDAGVDIDYEGINRFNAQYAKKAAEREAKKRKIKYSDRDSDGNQLSAEQQEFFKDSKVRDDQGRLIPMYHGTNTPDFTVFDPQKSDDHISLFFTSDPDVANTYTQLQDKGRDVDPYNLITKDSSAEQFNKAQERVGGGLRVVKITPEWIQEMKGKAEKRATRLFGVANKYADLLAYNNSTGVFNYDIERIRDVTGKGVEKLTTDDVNKLKRAMGSGKDHAFFATDHKGASREISRIYADTYKLFDEAWNYLTAAATPDSAIGQYTYTETNSSVPFMINRHLDFLGHIIPGTEKEMVAKAIDRMQWVEEHHLGNRYKVYLNITNPYVIDAGVNYSGKMDIVSLERSTTNDGWRVSFENAEHDEILYMTTTDFNAFIESAFDAKISAIIKAQIEADIETYRKEWGDDFYDDMDVDHDIQLRNVNMNYSVPGNWNALNFNGNENARTRDVAAWAKENGYDGVIFKNMKDAGGYAFMKGRGGSTVVTAFSSEQVKSVDNKKPTTDPDMRYSDRDSDGNQLSEDQQEFFAESKARDENGNLYVMYHGSRSPLFTEFDMYEGVWMTPDQRYAEVYAEMWHTWRDEDQDTTGLERSVYADPDYRLYKMYANITNPLDLGEINDDFNRKQLNRLARLLGVPASRIKGLAYDEYGYETIAFVYQLTKEKEFIDIAREKGYDGFTAKERGIKTFCAFNAPNQVKLTTNEVPSGFYDIRYQDRADDSVSNRSLLANAFESVAQNDIERQRLQEYKGKISLIESEERKLSELNQKIKDLSFGKGPKDTKAIRDLQFEARQTANRISTFDKQLLRLEASKPLQDVLTREKKMAYDRAKQKGKEALEAYREKATKTQRELLDKWQESRKKGIESRHKTAMRHKIKDVVDELNQYLLRGTKDRHVPIELQKAVAEALDAVNMDTVGAEERIAKLQAELMKAKTPEQIQEISRKIDRVQQMGDKMNGRLRKLKDAYDQFVNSDDPLIANSHDEVISNKLQSVIETVGDTPLRDMTLTQLEDVYDMYRMVLTTIRNANKAFKAQKNESISTIANRVMEEVDLVGGKKKLSRKGMDGIKRFAWNNLKPVYAFAHIGSHTFTEVFNNVRDGEDTWALDVTEAREFYLDKSKKYGYDSWDFNKRYKFTSTSGMDFELNLEQIMSLYAYSKREQAADHLKKGGIVIDETTEITVKNKLGIPVKFNPTEATAYNISEDTLDEIVSKLTKEQEGFVDEMQEYLSTVMGAKGNEVSLQMYGVKLFKEKFYFPLKSAHQFMAKAKEQAQGEVKIKNSGFSKETVQKASNPIVLTPFMNVWAGHVNEMSMYHAFVLPMEDFYRVYNYKTPTSDTMATESVEMYIQNAYGKGATKYIDQLLKDLNGGARTDYTTGFINKMMGLFKKGAVFASMSVVVQQPSAIARATAMVDTKYFIGPKVDHKRHKALWDEVKEYAPVAIIKEMGYFDTNMGKSTQDFILGKEYSGFKEKMKALVNDSNYRDEILSKAPALADEIAWCSIWEAVKRETKAKNPGMDVKSESFLIKAGMRFTDVIVKTQVYDSVLSRSANMRSKDTGMKMATAFMAEPTTSINMIADALLQGKRGDKKYARKAIGSVVAAQILNAILVSFVYAARDDDEDETYLEKYIGSVTGEIVDSLNPAGYIPFIKDILSIVQGYDVERSDMSVISDLWKAWENLTKEDVSVYRKVEGFVGSISQIFGLPVKNIMRDVRGIYQTIMSAVNGEKTTKAGIGYAISSALPKWVAGGETSDKNQLYDAYLSGDEEHLARVKERIGSEADVNSAMRTAIKDHFLDGDIDADTAMKYLTNYCGDEADDAFWKVEEWRHDKQFEEDFGKYNEFYGAVQTGTNLKAIIQKYTDNGVTTETLVSQISSHFKPLYIEMSTSEKAGIKGYILNAMTLLGVTREEAEEKVRKWEFEGKSGFSYDNLAKNFKEGKISAADAKSAIMQVEKKTEEEAVSRIVGYSTDAYKDGLFSRSDAKAVLVTYGGMTDGEAESKLRYIDVKKQLPDTYVDDAWVEEYYSEVEASGISIEVFVDYRNQVKGITGDGKKERRMAVIDSLPITSAQKDALYYAEGWAASKIWQAPWH